MSKWEAAFSAKFSPCSFRRPAPLHVHTSVERVYVWEAALVYLMCLDSASLCSFSSLSPQLTFYSKCQYCPPLSFSAPQNHSWTLSRCALPLPSSHPRHYKLWVSCPQWSWTFKAHHDPKISSVTRRSVLSWVLSCSTSLTPVPPSGGLLSCLLKTLISLVLFEVYCDLLSLFTCILEEGRE